MHFISVLKQQILRHWVCEDAWKANKINNYQVEADKLKSATVNIWTSTSFHDAGKDGQVG